MITCPPSWHQSKACKFYWLLHEVDEIEVPVLPGGVLYSTKSIQLSAFMKRRYVPRLVPSSCAAVEMHGSILNDAMPCYQH